MLAFYARLSSVTNEILLHSCLMIVLSNQERSSLKGEEQAGRIRVRARRIRKWIASIYRPRCLSFGSLSVVDFAPNASPELRMNRFARRNGVGVIIPGCSSKPFSAVQDGKRVERHCLTCSGRKRRENRRRRTSTPRPPSCAKPCNQAMDRRACFSPKPIQPCTAFQGSLSYGWRCCAGVAHRSRTPGAN